METSNSADIIWVECNARDGTLSVQFVRREDYNNAWFNRETLSDEMFLIDFDSNENDAD